MKVIRIEDKPLMVSGETMREGSDIQVVPPLLRCLAAALRAGKGQVSITGGTTVEGRGVVVVRVIADLFVLSPLQADVVAGMLERGMHKFSDPAGWLSDMVLGLRTARDCAKGGARG